MTQILTKDFPQNTSETSGYTSAVFSADEWQQLVTQSEGTIHWRVGIYHDDGYYETGPYYSSLYTAELFNDTQTLTVDQIWNRTLSTSYSPCLWFCFTAPEKGGYGFYTTGEIDTYGELFSSPVAGLTTTVNLIQSDDSSGEGNNFAIYYPMDKNETVYLRIRSLTGAEGAFSIHTSFHAHTYVEEGFHYHSCHCTLCNTTLRETHSFVVRTIKGKKNYTCRICGYHYEEGGQICFGLSEPDDSATIIPNVSIESKKEKEENELE